MPYHVVSYHQIRIKYTQRQHSLVINIWLDWNVSTLRLSGILQTYALQQPSLQTSQCPRGLGWTGSHYCSSGVLRTESSERNPSHCLHQTR